MDLVGARRPLKADLIGGREPVVGPGEGVVIVVVVAIVDLVDGPAVETEGVARAEVDEGEVEGAGTGGPGWGGVEEEVADEVFVG